MRSDDNLLIQAQKLGDKEMRNDKKESFELDAVTHHFVPWWSAMRISRLEALPDWGGSDLTNKK